MSQYWSQDVRELTPYVPGEQPRERVIKLNTNENPYPPAPGVSEALRNYAVDHLRLYPDPTSLALRETLADTYGVSVAETFVGNGSDEVLAYVQGWKTGFPDLVGKCENRIDAGDVLVEECSWTSTNTGNLVAPDGSTIPPTGKSVNLKNVLIWEFQDGKVKPVKNYLDMMTMLSQLGLAG